MEDLRIRERSKTLKNGLIMEIIGLEAIAPGLGRQFSFIYNRGIG